MVFEADAWDSTISFAHGIPVTLGGTLELTFAGDVDVADQVGRTFDLFDWTGVSPTGDIAVSSPYPWDLSSLYTTGEVTLSLSGDYNGDGTVEQADLDLVLANWGQELINPTASGWQSNLPTGPIDQHELDKVLLGWGSTAAPASAAAISEPTTLVLLLIAIAICWRCSLRLRSSARICGLGRLRARC
jgi:hypothetical protein